MIAKDNKKILSISKYENNDTYISKKTLKEINSIRKSYGLKELISKNRNCICCKKIIKNTTSERICQSYRNNINNTY